MRLRKIARYVRLTFAGSIDILLAPIYFCKADTRQLRAPVVKSRTTAQLVVHAAAWIGEDTCMQSQFTATLGYTWRSN